MGEHRTPRDEASPATEPTPLGGEQIAIVAAVYRRFARLAAESLTALARTPLQVRLTAVQRLAMPGTARSLGGDGSPGQRCA